MEYMDFSHYHLSFSPMDSLAFSHYDDLLSYSSYFPDDPLMAFSPNHTHFNPQLWDMDQQFQTPFLAERSAPMKTNEKHEISQDQDTNYSAMEEQHSEILCGEGESGSNRPSGRDIVESKKKRKRKRNKSVERLPKVSFRTISTDADVLEDGYKWRKYGKKSIKNSPHLRSYYKCCESSCCVKKKVERDPSDREVLITTYEGRHNHESPGPTEICYVVDPFGSYHMILLSNQGLCSSTSPAHTVLYQ